MATSNYDELLEKYRLGECSEAELRQLEAWYADWNAGDRILLSESDFNKAEAIMRTEVMKRTGVKKVIPWRKLTAAASIALVLGSGLYYFYRSVPAGRDMSLANTSVIERIPPGMQGATLTLANGQKIRLSDAKNGALAEQAGVSILKSADGRLTYELNNNHEDASQYVNTLSTEKGQTYQLHLPDGSLVILNAASRLTYNAALVNDGKRVVKLSGEAYFEIHQDPAHPFIVESNGQQVQVLGTHFNVNSYPDENVQRTTLLEGSVKVTGGAKSTVLVPGQQAVFTAQGTLSAANADVSQAVAWKDGLFNFSSADIQTVMRQMSRWYNVDVEYEGGIPGHKITGKVHRDAELSDALLILKYLDINYTVKDRTIIIKP